MWSMIGGNTRIHERKEIMQQNIDSDVKSTMLASKIFQQIVDQVQSSNLNFQLLVSPFSAQISLKKSFITDKSGNLLLPQTNVQTQSYESFNKSHDSIENLINQNKKLQKELLILHRNHEGAVNDLSKASETIEALENQIKSEMESVISSSVIEEHESEIKELRQNNAALQSRIDDQDETISEMKIINKNSREATDRINKELHEHKIKYSKEKAVLIKEHKTEVKAWRKELGEVTKENIKLKAKLESKLDEQAVVDEASAHIHDNPPLPPRHEQQVEPEVICSICTDPIIDYKPKYFMGEVFSPACSKCDDSFEGDDTGPDTSACMHTPQCVSRQPYPPPSPSMPYIFHEVSKYHVHMMTISLTRSSRGVSNASAWIMTIMDVTNARG